MGPSHETCAETRDAAMRTLPLGLSMETHMGPRNVLGVCRNGLDATMRTLPLGPWVNLHMGP